LTSKRFKNGVEKQDDKQVLIDFRDKYRNFTSDTRRAYSETEKLRIELQHDLYLVAGIIYRVHGGRNFNLRDDKQVNFEQMLLSSLVDNFADERQQKYIEKNVASILNEAIGNITNDTIPSKKIQPILPIIDSDLKNRCFDLLQSSGSFDRVIREATVIFEHKLRSIVSHDRLSEVIPNSADQTGEILASKLLAPKNPIIIVSDDYNERLAFLKIVQGVLAYLRNPSHHSLKADTKISLAWSVVGLIDSLIQEIKNARIDE